MNFNEIENLVANAKLGDTKAKERLVSEFTPLIINLSKKSFINSYEFSDIKNECYKTLFKCVQLYDLDKHRFVAYATNAIKNSVNYLIRVSIRRAPAEGSTSLILDGSLENTLFAETDCLEDILQTAQNKIKLEKALLKLNSSDRELINYIYFKKYTLRKYATLKDIPYSTLVSKKNAIINKLKLELKVKENYKYIN